MATGQAITSPTALLAQHCRDNVGIFAVGSSASLIGQVEYRDKIFNAKYLNWLVGNGFVLAGGFGNEALDTAAKKRIEGYFPGRDVYVIDILESWYDGGGVHCHTNDQPAI